MWWNVDKNIWMIIIQRMTPDQILGPICSAIGDIPHTFISSIWFWVDFLFTRYWYIIVPVIVIWVIIEIISKGGHSFNSDNGFTPTFNSFVGGGVFILTEKLIHFILEFFSGPTVHCGTLFMSSFYLLPFLTTGLFLNMIGFWVYWKIPFIKLKI